MEQDKHKTTVFFRKWEDGQIIALFLDEVNYPGGMIESYMHIGQHSSATPELIQILEDASPEEYEDLKNELESIGYNLKVKR